MEGILNERLLLTVPEVADRLHCSRTTVYALMLGGDLPSVKLGKSRRIPAEALRRWVEARTEAERLVMGGDGRS